LQNELYCLLWTLLLPTALANSFSYGLQRTLSIVPTLCLYILFTCLFVNGILLTTLSQFPPFYSTSLLTSPQTVILNLISYSLVTHATSTHYLLKNLANLSANVLSVIVTKYNILDNLLYTTRITFFFTTNSNC